MPAVFAQDSVSVSFFSLTSSTLDVNEFSICTSTNTVSVLLRTLLDFEEFGERFIVLRYFAVNVVKWYPSSLDVVHYNGGDLRGKKLKFYLRILRIPNFVCLAALLVLLSKVCQSRQELFSIRLYSHDI